MSNTISEIKVDKTALSYWFPKLVEAGIPVPRTKIVHMRHEARQACAGVSKGSAIPRTILRRAQPHPHDWRWGVIFRGSTAKVAVE